MNNKYTDRNYRDGYLVYSSNRQGNFDTIIVEKKIYQIIETYIQI